MFIIIIIIIIPKLGDLMYIITICFYECTDRFKSGAMSIYLILIEENIWKYT